MAEMLRMHSAPFGYHPNEIIELMASLGYSCHASTEAGWRPFERMEEETVETNFLFLHRDRHAGLVAEWWDAEQGLLVPPAL